MTVAYYGIHWVFGDDWHEVWVPDVCGACVLATTEEEAFAEILDQLNACFETASTLPPGYNLLPAPSDEATAFSKALDGLNECADDYPPPIAHRMVLIPCAFARGVRYVAQSGPAHQFTQPRLPSLSGSCLPNLVMIVASSPCIASIQQAPLPSVPVCVAPRPTWTPHPPATQGMAGARTSILTAQHPQTFAAPFHAGNANRAPRHARGRHEPAARGHE